MGWFADIVAVGLWALLRFFEGMLYGIWGLLGQVVSLIQMLFLMVAGVHPMPGDNNFIQNLILEDVVQQIFTNLMAIAIILMIFFTIIVLIRNHYKEQDGGNPYKIVFRMFGTDII